MIAHASDLPPGNVGPGGEQVFWEGLDGLADLKQPDPYRIEHQAIGEITALQVGSYRLDRGLDVSESLPISVAHRATRSRSARLLTSGLRSAAGTRSTWEPTMASSSWATRPRPNRPMPGGTSASRSKSLSGRSCPRATLPNTRRSVTPW